MKHQDVVVGERYAYYPTQGVGENLHREAVVESVTKARVRVRVGADMLTVHPKRLTRQGDLFRDQEELRGRMQA